MDMGLRYTFVPGRRQSLKSLIWTPSSQLWKVLSLVCLSSQRFMHERQGLCYQATYTRSPIEHCQRVLIIFKGV